MLIASLQLLQHGPFFINFKMKFSASLVSYLLSAAALVVATPMDRRPYVKMLTKASARSPDGAVYCALISSPHMSPLAHTYTVITNQPDENMIISASIHSDGTLVRTLSVTDTRVLIFARRDSTGQSRQVVVGHTGTRPTATQAQTACFPRALSRCQRRTMSSLR